VPNKTFESASDTLGNAVPSIGDVASRMQERASALGEKASELGQDAVDAIDARRRTAASGLEGAAAGLHRNADKLPANVSQYAHQAADKLDATADYVRENTMQDALADLEAYVKAHPTQALLGAAVVGFCAGRLLSRD
jgi:ElaB/YqjD/DUF883 family membrane-anchored ribosome-binding protein